VVQSGFSQVWRLAGVARKLRGMILVRHNIGSPPWQAGFSFLKAIGLSSQLKDDFFH
jgi:hypothetical protein